LALLARQCRGSHGDALPENWFINQLILPMEASIGAFEAKAQL